MMDKLYKIIECLYLEMKHLKEKPVRKNKTKVKKTEDLVVSIVEELVAPIVEELVDPIVKEFIFSIVEEPVAPQPVLEHPIQDSTPAPVKIEKKEKKEKKERKKRKNEGVQE